MSQKKDFPELVDTYSLDPLDQKRREVDNCVNEVQRIRKQVRRVIRVNKEVCRLIGKPVPELSNMVESLALQMEEVDGAFRVVIGISKDQWQDVLYYLAIRRG